jgi:uncharacterized membrane protein YagU involved in acid resistance
VLSIKVSLEEMAKLRPQFVLFGDSITQLSFENGGWGAALAALYARQVLLSLLSISTHFFFCILFALFCFVSDVDWDAGSWRGEIVQMLCWLFLLRLLFLSFFSPSPFRVS